MPGISIDENALIIKGYTTGFNLITSFTVY